MFRQRSSGQCDAYFRSIKCGRLAHMVWREARERPSFLKRHWYAVSHKENGHFFNRSIRRFWYFGSWLALTL